jgi:hypothetical protein
MRSSYPIAILGAVFTLTVTACSSSLVLPANTQIVPTQYHLSPADVYAIQRLAPAAGIKGDLHAITASSRDEVQVECGDPYVGGGHMMVFTAHRKDGQWTVDRASIGTYRATVVD